MASTMATQPATMNLLSLDGGGIRGLSSLYILADLMQMIKFSSNQDTEPLPADYFDMIGGSSTGGIIAIMLGRLRMSASECIAAYLKLGERVFGEQNKNSILQRTKFSEVELEAAIEETLEEKLGKGHKADKLMDPNTSGCKTFVCTHNRRTLGGPPTLLRSYQSGQSSVDCTIVQAARATSAAETFFPPATIGTQTYTDAGLGTNNPTEAMLREAEAYYRQRNLAAKKPTCIVSIGTGQMSLIDLEKAEKETWWSRLQIADRTGLNVAGLLAEIVSDCEETHLRVLNSCLQSDISHLYFRFNVDKGLEKLALDEYTANVDIEAATTKYRGRLSVERKPEDCAKILRFSREGTNRLGLQIQATHSREPARQPDANIAAQEAEQERQQSPMKQAASRRDGENLFRVKFGSTKAGGNVNQVGVISGNARMGGNSQ